MNANLSRVYNRGTNQKLPKKKNEGNQANKNYTLELISYLGKDNQRSPYYDQYLDYLVKSGFDLTRFIPLWNANNIVAGIIFILASIIASIYFSVMSYAKVSLEVVKKKETKSSLNRLIWMYILVENVIIFIFAAPFIVFFAGLFAFESLPGWFGILWLFIFLILLIAYFIFIGVRLLFALPILFIEERGVL